MDWKTTRLQTSFSPEQRIVVISDIHGNLPLFQGLLEKIHFSQEDILILLGDMLEKGKENLNLLRYIMKLEQSHQVYCLCGNCDAYVKRFFETSQYDESFFRNYFAHPKNHNSILLQMGRESGMESFEDLSLLRETLNRDHLAVKTWLDHLPIIIETEDYFFVHGGVEDMEHCLEKDPWDCMKNDYFYEQDHCFSKYIIVGHCPTTLYRPFLQDASPLIDHRRKIVSIDGGCVLKLDGQLNALLIQGQEFSWDYYDGLPQIRALDPQAASENPLNVRWGHAEVELLEEQGEFCLCKHKETNRSISILTSFLKKNGDTILCEDATDYQLPMQSGDIFALSQIVEGGVLGKKDGVTGWYWGKYEYIE